MNYFEIGKILKPHGVRGEMKVFPVTDYPEHFFDNDILFLRIGEDIRKFKIEKVRMTPKGIIVLKLEGIDTPEEVDRLRGLFFVVDSEHLQPLNEDEYYYHDILDCEVYDQNGLLVGVVIDIMEVSSSDIYVVRDKEGKEKLIPAIKTIIKNIDITKKRIEVDIPEGLF